MPDLRVANTAARRRNPIAERRQAIARLSPGTVVGHASSELADWEGVIEPDDTGTWWTMRFNGDVRIRWTAGLDGNGQPLADSKPGFIEATAVTVKGECPNCARPAHYFFAGNIDRSAGWHHDTRADADTCPANEAAFEANRATRQ